ncbi:YczE/YyaS/YitT family protein [Priestia koreensis]|uniref:YitT family protein n=1 Tax=Priestia koreensis TaxID=284581 RepID=A0A0M0L6L8_9BACI|nr:hypothetical protein [Priestia koreensis]KOO46492.1 hypothetical protein AMD01_11750 [Priestia koreensis]
MIQSSRINQYIIYLLGIVILALGIALTIQSDFGTSPFDALLVGLSLNVGLTVGAWEIIIALIMICCNALLQKKRPEVFGLLTAFITGICIDSWLFLLHSLAFELWFYKIGCFGCGLVIAMLGTSIYLQTNLAPIPIDRLMIILKRLTRTNILFSRTLINFFFIFMALVFNGPISVGTLMTVCFGGIILNFFMPYSARLVTILNTTNKRKYKLNKNHSI